MKKAVKKKKSSLSTERIGILGGAFNPIHIGHLNSALTVREKLKLDKVLFVPALNPPHREITGPSPKDRVALVEAALSRYKPELELDTQEIDRKGVSYTVDTLKNLAKKYQSKNMFFIMGADAFLKFPEWKNFSELLELSNFVVTTRIGSDLYFEEDSLPQGLEPFAKSVKVGEIKLKTGNKIVAIELEDIDASATEIRRRLRNGHDVRKWLTPAVLSIIEERGLYKRSSPLVEDYKKFAITCAQKTLDKKALDLKVYDMSKRNSYADYSVICSATSGRHATSIAEGILDYVREEVGLAPISVEGMRDGQWVLLDYGPLVIHVFQDAVRSQYKIESLWKNCKPIKVQDRV